MELSYTIHKRDRYYILCSQDDHILLLTTQKNLCYRYMYELQGLAVPDQYTKKNLDQDFLVDKRSN